MFEKKNSYRFVFLFIIVIQTLFLFCHMNKKDLLSTDEVYTYSLANSPFGFIFPSKILKPSTKYDIYGKWISGKLFKDYLTVAPSNEFNFTNVYINQLQETHPPFYYYLIHSVCSFFPEKYSKWYGLSLNILFFILTQFLLFHVSYNIFESKKKALLVCLLYGFSKASTDCFTFIGSSALLGVFNLLLLNSFIKNLNNENSDENSNEAFKKNFELFFIVLLGGYIHYLFLLYALSLIIVFSIISSKNKSKELNSVIGSYLFAVVVLYFLLPEMIAQINTSFQTSEIVIGMKTILPGLGFLLYYLIKFIFIPAPAFIYLTAFLLIGFFCYGFWILIDRYCNKNKQKIILTIIPVVIIFSLISLYMNYDYLKDGYIRYYYSYYPIVSIALILILTKFKKTYILMLFILLISFLNIHQLYLKYINCNDNNQLSIEKVLNNNNAILVFKNYQDIQLTAPYLALCDKIFLLPVQSKWVDGLYPPRLAKDDKVFMILPNNIIYKSKQYPLLLSKTISTEKIDVYEITKVE